MSLPIIVAGATGWTGSAVVDGILASPDLRLVGAVARRAAGQTVGPVTCRATLTEALSRDAAVLIDYTHPTTVKAHVLTALTAGLHVIIGTSGLSDADYGEIDAEARRVGRGVIAAGNFSLTATLLKLFARQAMDWIGDVEILDYASAGKVDAPSGTARELANHLAAHRQHPATARPRVEILGPVEARGADMGGIPVHSVRAPGFTLSCEALFGLAGERLSIRHDAGESAAPYVAGTLLAARKVVGITGLRRGLESVLLPE